MADNEYNNDEYKFSETDFQSNEHEEVPVNSTKALRADEDTLARTNVVRNALIVLGVVIIAMLLYKFGTGWFAHKNTTVVTKSTISTTPVISQPAKITTVSSEPAVVLPVQPVEVRPDNALNDRVAALEQSQQNMTTEVNSLSSQVATVTDSINSLNTQITSLNQTVTNLANQVAKQSEEINVLLIRSQPKKTKVIIHTIKAKPVIYHIQAIIPGRAWLIGTNGSTLTVREGTKIIGYGTVRLVDSIQGKILTSSGRTIKFSQQDS